MNSKKSILLGLLIIVVVIIATGCVFYNALDPEDFKKHLGALGYTINTELEPKYESKTYLVAEKTDVPYKVEYYSFDDDINAKKVYTKYKDSIGDYITTDSKNNESSNNVFSRTIAVSDNEYIVISRVRNTVIFISGTNDYAEEIDKLIEDIKY